MILRAFLFLVIISGFTSCLSNKKRLYYQGADFKYNEPYLIKNPINAYKLQINDLLSILIKSSAGLEVDLLYNLKPPNGTGGTSSNENALYTLGYLITQKGEITMPILGNILVVGKTVEEVKQIVEEKLANYLKNAIVDVKLVNFRVSIYGEVNRAGLFNVSTNRISIFQLISEAGDLTNFANRRNVKLIRQNTEGVEVIMLDLTKASILSSPYYYLQPNDQIYIEPLKAQTSRANLPLLTIIFSSISTTILLLNFIKK